MRPVPCERSDSAEARTNVVLNPSREGGRGRAAVLDLRETLKRERARLQDEAAALLTPPARFFSLATLYVSATAV